MKINYNITGEKRKALVGAISQELNVPVKYLGAPTFAYEVGGYQIDRNGQLEGEDDADLIADLRGLHSFFAVNEEYDRPMTNEEFRGSHGANEVFEDLKMTEGEELGLGKQRHDPRSEDGMRASDVPATFESASLTIEMPLEGFTKESITNLEKLVASKASLIKKAIGAESLIIKRSETTLKFPWFKLPADSDEVAAYSRFIGALCATSKEQKRVVAREKEVSNEKFAFRVFLIRLGFVGDDYKAARKILLRNLSGNSAFKNGRLAKVVADETSESEA